MADTRKSIVAVLTIFLAACLYFIAEFVATPQSVSTESSFTPFVFQVQVYLYGSNPAGELHATLTEARRSDGTTVEVRRATARGTAKWLYGRTIKYTDGSSVNLVDAIKSKTTLPVWSEKATAAYRRLHLYPPSNCMFGGETLLKEEDAVLGHPVTVVRFGSVNSIRVTAWRAPDLGCIQLQYRVEQQESDGSYKLMSQQKAVSLQLTAPDPRLFADGQGYTELTPSELTLKGRLLLGYTGLGDAAGSLARADKMYAREWSAHSGLTKAH